MRRSILTAKMEKISKTKRKRRKTRGKTRRSRQLHLKITLRQPPS
jgi:hypothetical protein